MRRLAPLLAVACLALTAAGEGSAGGVGTWSRVTATTLTNTDQAGLARNAGGLHLVWLAKAGAAQDLLQTTILPTGGQGRTTKVVAGWGSLADGSLAATSSGLQAFFAGIRSTSTSDPYASWYSNAAGGYGIHWRRVLPSLGADRVLPGSASADRKSAVSPIQPVGIVGRAGAPGVCTAWGLGYPTWKALDVACTSRAGAVRVWSGPVTHFTVAPALDGRVWAMWSTSSTIYAARSNRAVTQFGAAVSVAPPAGTNEIWNVTGDGGQSPTAPLDLLASVTTGGIAFWHTKVEPGLTLVVHGKQFAVLDAGDPVHGAHVQLAGPQAATLQAPAGTATAGALTPGRYTATATAAGYTSAKASFTVPRS